MTPQEQQLDAYVKQLKAMGVPDAAIAAAKAQFEASMKAAAQFMPNAAQLAQNMGAGMANMPGMEGFGGGISAADIKTGFEFEADEIKLSPKTTLTPDEQRAVACGADVAILNVQYLNDLTTGISKDRCVNMLSSSWGIDNRKEMLATIERLQKTGHRGQFALIAQAGPKDTARSLCAALTKAGEDADEETVAERLDNSRAALKQFTADGLIKKGGKAPDMMAWDFARIINISRGGFDAGYLKREEALDAIMDAAAKIRKTYKSWKELSVAYQYARYIWGGDDSYELMKLNMESLLSDKKSPWVAIKW